MTRIVAFDLKWKVEEEEVTKEMADTIYPGIGKMENMIALEQTSDKSFVQGKDGVQTIWTPEDKKVEFIIFEDKTLCYVKSALGYPAIYKVPEATFEGPAKAILMDLDGTSVHSETFWMWIIEQTVQKLKKDTTFSLETADEPHVSGHSVSEHLQYCINKYCPEKTIEEARQFYFEITEYEMREILEGRGRKNAFNPAPGLKEFLLEVKGNGIKIGLVTSGLYTKAMPEIISAFNTLNMSIRLAGFQAVGINGGNIHASGMDSLCLQQYDDLCDALPLVTGRS